MCASVVIETGSFQSKVGFSKEDVPRVVFPSVVGYKDVKGYIYWGKEYHVGDEAGSRLGELNWDSPIQLGLVRNWNDMEKIWQHAFSKALKVSPKAYPVLLVEPPLSPKMQRETTTQIMFEKFGVPSLYLANQAVLALHTSGRVTGVVMDSGYEVSHAVPVFEGYALPHATCKLKFGGKHVTALLEKSLKVSGHDLQDRNMKEIKLLHCHVVPSIEKEMTNPSPAVPYQLPDGRTVNIGNERFLSPEGLFQPSLLDKNSSVGIHEAVNNSVGKCHQSIRKDLYGSIVLSGGNTMFSGTAERLQKEVFPLAKYTRVVNVIAPPERHQSAWVGGSILASLDSFGQRRITKREYNEFGQFVVHKKCF